MRSFYICFFLISFVFCRAENRNTAIKLTQNIVDTQRGTLIVNCYYDLDDKTIVFPEGLVVKFQGGWMNHGTIVGTNTKLEIDKDACAFGKDLIIQGSWSVRDIYDKWFDFDSDKNYVSNQIVNNILSLTNDDELSHIYFNEDRVYYFNLPTLKAPNFGDSLTYHIEKTSDNKRRKKRHYNELFGEKFADYRIFTIPSNTWVTINSKFQMLPTNQGLYFVFWECGKKNIIIDGKGSISGDGKTHLYTDPFIKNTTHYGEWGYLFRCLKCENFTFKDIELSDSFGDLIAYGNYLLDDNTGKRESVGLHVENVRLLRARRNGISVSAKNVIIKNCLFRDCGIDEINGTAPRAAIDFETSSEILKYPGIGNENVVMENCIFKNNKYDVSATYVNVPDYGKTSVTIRNCLFSSPLRLNSTPHWIKFENCTIPSFTNSKGTISKSSPIKYVEFKDCKIKSIPVLMYTPRWHNKIVNCKVENIER